MYENEMGTACPVFLRLALTNVSTPFLGLRHPPAPRGLGQPKHWEDQNRDISQPGV